MRITSAGNGQVDSATKLGFRQNRCHSQSSVVAGVMRQYVEHYSIGSRDKGIMFLSSESDEEILKIAEPIRQDVIDGSNRNSWQQHSKHMPQKIIQNDEIKKDVERQWREVDYLSAMSREAEFIAIIRKQDSVTICWKQTSTISDDEYLLKIRLEEIDGVVKQVSALLD